MNNSEQNGTIGRSSGNGDVRTDRGLPPGLSKPGRARTRADLARPAQRTTIFALGRWLRTDVNKLCADSYLCRPIELSRGAADEFINRLKTLRPAQA